MAFVEEALLPLEMDLNPKCESCKSQILMQCDTKRDWPNTPSTAGLTRNKCVFHPRGPMDSGEGTLGLNKRGKELGILGEIENGWW
ncbi:hypothetical protein VNO77_39194 [Canavalia gladiata]|uniref:Uncharacterized protein n=1 Tax=Canavalia gladiata TaxID=3824 RepID=A0AAN9KD88_CANGL